MADDLKRKTLELKTYKERLDISRQEILRNNNVNFDNHQRHFKKEIDRSKNDLSRKGTNIGRMIKEEIAKRDIQKANNDKAMENLKHQLSVAETLAENQRKIKK